MKQPDNEAYTRPGYSKLIEVFDNILNIDLGSYAADRMQSRLRGLANSYGLDLSGLAERIASDESARQAAEASFTNNATSFFRGYKYWDNITVNILPTLLASRNPQPLRTWSAGCANGAEPYSLAIVLEELTPKQEHLILATDIDPSVLEEARIAAYGSVINVNQKRRASYFQFNGESYVLNPPVRDRVIFFRHDLLKDPYPRELDLLLCRHVTMHLTTEAAQRVQKRLAGALSPGGVLVFGDSEVVANSSGMGLEKISENTFRKLV